MKRFFTALVVMMVVLATSLALAAAPKVMGSGRLSLYNFHENEYLEVTYRDGNRYYPEVIDKIRQLMRSRGDGSEGAFDLRLIELISNIQGHFGAETVEIISGYRSPAYNRALKEDGRGVARESLHMRGLAADIHIDEVSEEDVFNYAKGLKTGGVGIYPKYAFVHVDIGAPRTWREAPARERILMGTQNNRNEAWSAVTDKDNYGRSEDLSIAITNNGYKKEKLIKNVWIEHFSKGSWSKGVEIDKEGGSESLKPGEAGKYEWKIPEELAFGKYRMAIFTSRDFSIPPVYSNEFYVKRQSQ